MRLYIYVCMDGWMDGCATHLQSNLFEQSALLDDDSIEVELGHSALNDLFLQRVFSHKPKHIHLLGLPDAMSAILSLQVHLRIPGNADSNVCMYVCVCVCMCAKARKYAGPSAKIMMSMSKLKPVYNYTPFAMVPLAAPVTGYK